VIALAYGIPTDKEGIQLRLGIERGFFRHEGIDLTLRVVFGGPEIAAAYSSGALKIGELGSPPATTALSKGARFRIVASAIRAHALQYLVVAPTIDDWEALRGTTAAALSIGSCSYWFMRAVLAGHGLDPDRDVRVVGLGRDYPRVVELFEAGDLQAAVLSEPNVSIGEDRGAFRVLKALTDAEFCPTMQWSVTVANADVIAREPDLVAAVLRGCMRSYCNAVEHPDELAAFGARYFGLPIETVRKSIAREANGLRIDGRIDLATLQEAIDLQRRLGAFDGPMAAESIVDHSFGSIAPAERCRA
jgi:ABC-type nitrate/sulfonate/bicarbonate transport system substrate-binding protein